MSIKRITISLPEEIASKAQRAVDSGFAESVSAYFTQLAESEPDWAAAEETANRVLEEIGEVAAEDEEWVDSMLDPEQTSVSYAA